MTLDTDYTITPDGKLSTLTINSNVLTAGTKYDIVCGTKTFEYTPIGKNNKYIIKFKI